MPRKTKTTAAADNAAQPQFSTQLLDQLVPGPMTPGQMQGIFEQFKKALFERALGAEMSHHLGYAAGQVKLITTASAPLITYTAAQIYSKRAVELALYRW